MVKNIDGEEKKEEGVDEELEDIEKVMGFSSFESSKHKDHRRSAVEGVFNSKLKRKCRQYLNHGKRKQG